VHCVALELTLGCGSLKISPPSFHPPFPPPPPLCGPSYPARKESDHNWQHWPWHPLALLPPAPARLGLALPCLVRFGSVLGEPSSNRKLPPTPKILYFSRNFFLSPGSAHHSYNFLFCCYESIDQRPIHDRGSHRSRALLLIRLCSAYKTLPSSFRRTETPLLSRLISYPTTTRAACPFQVRQSNEFVLQRPAFQFELPNNSTIVSPIPRYLHRQVDCPRCPHLVQTSVSRVYAGSLSFDISKPPATLTSDNFSALIL